MPSWRSEPLPPGWQKTRRRILATHGAICHVCGQAGADEVDHVIPVVRGGSDADENLAPIHRVPCHSIKTAREARGEPRKRHAESHPGVV